MLAWNWSPAMRSASASSSARKPSCLSVFFAALSSSSAAYGDLATLPMRLSSILVGDVDGDLPLDRALDLAGLVRRA